jgi:hypothetical protein
MRATLAGGFLVMAVFTFAACGGEEKETSDQRTTPTETTTPTKPAETSPAGPLECLEEAELENAEQRDSDLWRGTDPSDGTLVIVDRMTSAADATQAVRDADLVWSASAGRYFVHGAFREAGDSAKVEAVAQCLRGR